LTSVSDADFKTDVRNISDTEALSAVLSLRPVYFKWNSDAPSSDYDLENIGFIAQEVQDALPSNGIGIVKAIDESGHLGVAYDKISVILVAAVQEQHEEILKQQRLIDTQKEEILRQKRLIDIQNEEILKLRQDTIDIADKQQRLFDDLSLRLTALE